MLEEIWKPIAGYEGLYEVSNLGRVKSKGLRKDKMLKLNKQSRSAYQLVDRDGSCLMKRARYLVAEAFCPKPLDYNPDVHDVIHTNKNKLDLRAENLAWGKATRVSNRKGGLIVRYTDGTSQMVDKMDEAAASLGIHKVYAYALSKITQAHPTMLPRIERTHASANI